MRAFGLIGLGVVTAFASSAVGQEVFPADAAASRVEWEGTKVVGGSHHGTVSLKSGSLVYRDGKPVSGVFVVDMTSLKNQDLTDPEWNEKLVVHLKSDDFFSVAKHPTSRLEIREIIAGKGNSYTLKGVLTIKGTAQPVSFPAEVVKNGKEHRLTGKLVFDRTRYDIRYGSGKFFQNLGDKMISDEVTVKADVRLQPASRKTAQK